MSRFGSNADIILYHPLSFATTLAPWPGRTSLVANKVRCRSTEAKSGFAALNALRSSGAQGRHLCRFGAVFASFRAADRPLLSTLCGKRATAGEISKATSQDRLAVISVTD
jgi:hypothetical protein